jgi:hypothetical protein
MGHSPRSPQPSGPSLNRAIVLWAPLFVALWAAARALVRLLALVRRWRAAGLKALFAGTGLFWGLRP